MRLKVSKSVLRAILALGTASFACSAQVRAQGEAMAPAKAETAATSSSAVVADSAEKAKPLQAGAMAPAPALKDLEGKTVKLKDVYAKGPTIIVFFRGGWCPFCNQHFADLKTVQKELKDAGFQLVAISPETPDSQKTDAAANATEFQLLSDASATAIKEFGLAFKNQGRMVDMLNTRSGFTHAILPVPAVYIVDKTGKIVFVHTDPDYKKRIAGADLVKAAMDAKAKM